jgi:hypothetical protein
VWIEVQGTTARVYLADASWERVLVRTVPMPNGPDEIAREQIAHIVAGSIEALMGGATIGVGREDARVSLGVEKPKTKPPAVTPSPSPSPSPGPKPQATIAGTAAIGYEGALYAPSVLSHALGVWTDARSKPLADARGWVAVGVLFRFPIVADRDPIGVRLDAIGPRLMVGASFSLSRSLSLRSGLGGGVDVLRVEPRGAPNSTVEPVSTSIVPIARVSALADVRLSASSSASVGVVVEGELRSRSYIVLADGRPEEVLAPYRVRPGIVLSITSQIW